MNGEVWIYGSILALIALQVLTLAVAYWRGEGPFDSSESIDPETVEDGAVRCNYCGVENAVEYRFCRRCVTELPGAFHPGRSPAPPLGRGSR